MRPLSQLATLTGESISPGATPDEYFHHFSFPAFDQGQLPLREHGETILSNKLAFSSPCVLIGKLNPRIPRIWYVSAQGELRQIASTEFVPIKPREEIPLSVLYAYATSQKVAGALQSRSHGTSTSHQRVRPNDVLSINLPVPPQEMLTKAVDPSLADIRFCLQPPNGERRLADSRDLLLPRLISGELSVSAAERELEAVA